MPFPSNRVELVLGWGRLILEQLVPDIPPCGPHLLVLEKRLRIAGLDQAAVLPAIDLSLVVDGLRVREAGDYSLEVWDNGHRLVSHKITVPSEDYDIEI